MMHQDEENTRDIGVKINSYILNASDKTSTVDDNIAAIDKLLEEHPDYNLHNDCHSHVHHAMQEQVDSRMLEYICKQFFARNKNNDALLQDGKFIEPKDTKNNTPLSVLCEQKNSGEKKLKIYLRAIYNAYGKNALPDLTYVMSKCLSFGLIKELNILIKFDTQIPLPKLVEAINLTRDMNLIILAAKWGYLTGIYIDNNSLSLNDFIKIPKFACLVGAHLNGIPINTPHALTTLDQISNIDKIIASNDETTTNDSSAAPNLAEILLKRMQTQWHYFYHALSDPLSIYRQTKRFRTSINPPFILQSSMHLDRLLFLKDFLDEKNQTLPFSSSLMDLNINYQPSFSLQRLCINKIVEQINAKDRTLKLPNFPVFISMLLQNPALKINQASRSEIQSLLKKYKHDARLFKKKNEDIEIVLDFSSYREEIHSIFLTTTPETKIVSDPALFKCFIEEMFLLKENINCNITKMNRHRAKLIGLTTLNFLLLAAIANLIFFLSHAESKILIQLIIPTIALILLATGTAVAICMEFKSHFYGKNLFNLLFGVDKLAIAEKKESLHALKLIMANIAIQNKDYLKNHAESLAAAVLMIDAAQRSNSKMKLFRSFDSLESSINLMMKAAGLISFEYEWITFYPRSKNINRLAYGFADLSLFAKSQRETVIEIESPTPH